MSTILLFLKTCVMTVVVLSVPVVTGILVDGRHEVLGACWFVFVVSAIYTFIFRDD